MNKLKTCLVITTMALGIGCNTGNNNDPSADFNSSFTNANQRAPASVTFTDASTGATQYHWTFGDGNVSNLQNDVHVFATGGTFTVWHAALGNGKVDSISKNVVILPPYSGLMVQTLIVTGCPITNLGNPWDTPGGSDPGGDPDMYIVLKNQSMTILTQTSPVSNQLPPIGGSVDYTLPNLTQTYTVEVYDDDGAVDQLMGTATFNVTTDIISQTNPYPSAFTYGSTVGMSMNLQWIP